MNILTPQEATGLLNLISVTDGEIVITSHVSPDGDAIGSSLAMYHVLRKLGKTDVAVVTPDTPPRNLSFLPGFHEIVVATREPARARLLFDRAKLIVCLDFNALMRVDRLRETLERATGPKILIDHHLSPEPFARVSVSRPSASSTCYLLYQVLDDLGMDRMVGLRAAECLTTGMMTDTGNFTYNSRDPELYRVMARMIEKGVDKDRIYKLVFDTNSEARLRLCGFALYQRMHVIREHGLAIITISKRELDEFGYTKGDTESLVNKPLSIPDVVWSVFLRQDEPGFVKVSCRSKGHFPVNVVCERYFGGGGHENAAGGEFYGSLDEAVGIILSAAPEMDKYLHKK